MELKRKITGKVVKRSILLALLVFLVVVLIVSVANSFSSGHITTKSTIPQSVNNIGDYGEYLKQYIPTKDDGDNEYLFPNNVNIKLGTNSIISHSPAFFLDSELKAIITLNSGYVTWEVNIPQNGFYNIGVNYYSDVSEKYSGSDDVQSSGINIERRLLIDGATKPLYTGLGNVVFPKVWGDNIAKLEQTTDSNNNPTYKFQQDILGNDMRPQQVEIQGVLRETYVKDSAGYVTDPYLIYFTQGKHTITLESVREVMAIESLIITSRVSYDTYADYINKYPNATVVEGKDLVYQAEDPATRTASSPTLYAISDRTSAYNTPNDPVKTKLNSIGGTKWTTAGEWISWDIEVEETGLYQLSFRSKQNELRGIFSTRTLYINNQVPFAEARNLKFFYNSKWDITTLGDEDGNPYYIYLEAGKNTISLELTLGDYGIYISMVKEVIDTLNRLYRDIIVYTTVNPDKYTDYYLDQRIPHMISTFADCAAELREVAASMTEISGEKSELTATLEKMAVLIEGFAKNYRKVQQQLAQFRDNVAALGTWVITVTEQPLMIDCFYLHGNDYKLPNANPNAFRGTIFSLSAFFRSFTFDYDLIGATEQNQGNRNIDVWVLQSATVGREHANAIRSLIDTTFDGDINVTLKLVADGVLLPSTIAGRGPDVAITVANGTPVNYAVRNAIYDLTNFSDFKVVDGYAYVNNETTSRFQTSSMVPYAFTDADGHTGYYALPDTQSFIVMFYRTDIFEEKGWEVPQTWDDVINLIPELQTQNLQFYIPTNASGANAVNSIYASLLYQRGGTFYKNNNAASNFDSEESIQAFEFWTSLYTDYGFPKTASFLNRFRSGEMPIGISSYELYNTLAVSAPEIRGKWSFALLPGTKTGNGEIDYTGTAGGTAAVIMKNKDDRVGASAAVKSEVDAQYAASWEFLKWWTSTATQMSYARELETILGAAGRHTTANIEAFKRLAWTAEERNVLLQQWETSEGVPEVPGGYYTGRNLENAFRYVINNYAPAKDTFLDYIKQINDEITKKRIEFGLPIA